jgi:hypothetical protein
LGLVVGLAAVALPPLGSFAIVALVGLVLLWVMPDRLKADCHLCNRLSCHGGGVGFHVDGACGVVFGPIRGHIILVCSIHRDDFHNQRQRRHHIHIQDKFAFVCYSIQQRGLWPFIYKVVSSSIFSQRASWPILLILILRSKIFCRLRATLGMVYIDHPRPS